MQVVQILSMNQQVQHIVPLSANLDTGLDPVQFRVLEEFGALESFEQTPLLLSLGPLVMKTVQNPALEKLLIADPHFHWVSLRTLLFEPLRD